MKSERFFGSLITNLKSKNSKWRIIQYGVQIKKISSGAVKWGQVGFWSRSLWIWSQNLKIQNCESSIVNTQKWILKRQTICTVNVSWSRPENGANILSHPQRHMRQTIPSNETVPRRAMKKPSSACRTFLQGWAVSPRHASNLRGASCPRETTRRPILLRLVQTHALEG